MNELQKFSSNSESIDEEAITIYWFLGTDSRLSDVDGQPYSTLLYGNGPGFTSPRAVPGNGTGDTTNVVHTSAVPRQWATHGGEDVPVYAQGKHSYLLSFLIFKCSKFKSCFSCLFKLYLDLRSDLLDSSNCIWTHIITIQLIFRKNEH